MREFVHGTDGVVPRELSGTFLGVLQDDDGTLTVIYAPDREQVLEAHKEYHIVIEPIVAPGVN